MLGDEATNQIGCASTSEEDANVICEGAEWIGALIADWLQFKMHALVAGLVHFHGKMTLSPATHNRIVYHYVMVSGVRSASF